MSLYKTEFPYFDDELYCPTGFVDASYHNDSMPHVMKRFYIDGNEIEVIIWQDYKNIDYREYDDTERYILYVVVNGKIRKEVRTNDLNEIKKIVANVDEFVKDVIKKELGEDMRSVNTIVDKILEGEDIYKTIGERMKKEIKESNRDDDLVDVYVKIGNKWEELFNQIPRKIAEALWDAGFKTGENKISIEDETSKRIAAMNYATLHGGRR